MMKILLICSLLLALCGCRVYWHDDFFIAALGEATVKEVDYVQEPNSISFHMVGYDVGEKVKPTVKEFFGE